ncbi:18673_t:CDS:2, partial [Dentiscutata erythropus]
MSFLYTGLSCLTSLGLGIAETWLLISSFCDVGLAPSFGEIAVVDIIIDVPIFVGFWVLSMFVACFETWDRHQ